MNKSTLVSRQAKPPKILIVEDESIIAADIQDCLESLGYQVVTISATGAEAIADAAVFQPNLVLMDIRLKGELDGIQAARYIWQQYQIPIIYVTGYSDQATLERATATGPFGYILKPIEEKELYVTIETALQRHQIDIELQKREQWLSTILQNIGDGVIVVDQQERVKFLNLTAQQMTGWQQHEAIGQPIADIFRLIDAETGGAIAISVAHTQAGPHDSLPREGLLLSKTGTTTPISDSIAPLHDETHHEIIQGAVLVFRDITEQKLAEQHRLAIDRARQLEVQMDELKRLDLLKDDFLATVSHELRTPLSNIKMATQMLEIVLQNQGMLSPGQENQSSRIPHYIKILRDQCNQELALVNDLLDLQRLNAKAYNLQSSPLRLQDWLPHLLESFEARFSEQQQQLTLSIEPSLPPIFLDQSSFARIITELLNNACKYTPKGGQVSISAHPVQSTEHLTEANSYRNNLVEIRVCNSGVQISPAELTRVFDQFYRIPQSDRWRQGGTGLGLTLVKSLVTYLGGTIKAESHANVTCFSMHLPITSHQEMPTPLRNPQTTPTP